MENEKSGIDVLYSPNGKYVGWFLDKHYVFTPWKPSVTQGLGLTLNEAVQWALRMRESGYKVRILPANKKL